MFRRKKKNVYCAYWMKHIFQTHLLENIPYIFLAVPNQYTSITKTMMLKKKTETLNNFPIFYSVAFEFVRHGTPF